MKEQNANGDTFIYYPDYIEQADAITDERLQFAIYKAIAHYGVYGTPPNFDNVDNTGVLNALFINIKKSIDAVKQKRTMYQENGRKGAEFGKLGAEYGKLGGRPRKTPPPDDGTPQDRQEEEIITAEEVTPKNTPKRFVKPTLKELRDYIFEEGINAEAEAIFDYYEANGWNVGKNKMKDWRACVRNWARRQSEFAPKQTKHKDTGVRFSATCGDDYNDWLTDDKPEAQTQTLMEAIMQGWASGERELERIRNQNTG